MTLMTLPRPLVIAALVATALVSFGLGRLTASESCDSWKDRHTEAIANAIYGLDARGTLAAVEAQRPAGCR